ncbi:glutaredoxin family protein [Staphylococcus succinus]|uniref:Glutaredoxin family protein n=3 Tax=Staphylococcus TaxID=1279 RepID=A0A9Q6HNP0_9STAP|nr:MULTISPECIES: glutaredoxin family protein [Staphylococcus]MDH9160966.1 glutaredoxin family protein [Staphylococcus succinus]MEB8124194.1 glutaredoxin family protein [Staphylococcus succinus]MEB8126192.1 glutaredoxin family protein [Staphylococcus succinus]MEB8209765.1 glutaredoxin family protein [Staphylococcus succinus]OIJ30379.1 NrdH-redoxin [Staphylococcus sp. LCT-H4]
MNEVIIYTQNDCPPCTFIKSYLTDKGVTYSEKNISNTQYRNEMMDHDAFATPFILLNDEPMYQIDMDKLNRVLNIE